MRSKIYLILLWVLVACSSHLASAQSIRRSVIAATGGSFSNGQVHVSSTTAQPPNPGTVLGSNGVYLRQGFQQPLQKQGGADDDCVLTASFDDEFDNQGNCGTYYSFTFTGTADPDLQYAWNFGEGAMPPVSSDMNPSQVAYITSGLKTIVLLVTKDTCTKAVSRIIEVTDVAFGALSISTDLLCFGDNTGSIELEVYNGETPFTYQWDNGSTDERLTSLVPGDYSFTVTDANGCVFSGTEDVEGPVAALASVIEYKDESCIGTVDGEIALVVEGGTAPYTIEWSNGETSDLLTGLSAGSYGVTITDDNACVLDTTITLIVFCEDGGNGIPDVISPNGDGINDVWVIPGIENYPDNQVFIFNRWGEKVFDMKSYMNNWSGTYSNGDPLAVGAYFYLIELNDLFETRFSGSITVIR